MDQLTLGLPEPANPRERRCAECGRTRPIADYWVDGRGSHSGRRLSCKDCCGDAQRHNRATRPDVNYTMYRHAARSRNYEWHLTKEEFEKLWQQPCQYCGDPIPTIGIDRVDNTLGYFRGNVVPCCTTCNLMKGTSSRQEYVDQCRKVQDKAYKDMAPSLESTASLLRTHLAAPIAAKHRRGGPGSGSG